MNEILTKEEVANLLDCEISTIEEKARTRYLPGLKIGKSWLFPKQALLQRLNELALEKPEPVVPTSVQIAPRRQGNSKTPSWYQPAN